MARRRRFGQRTIRQDYWEAHETVTIQGMTEADTEWVQDMAVMLKNNPAIQSEPELHVLSGSSRRATMIRAIVSWTLTDEHGQGLPWPPLFDGQGNVIAANLAMRSKMIGTLAPEDAAFIEAEINKLNQPMSKEEQETFLQTVAPGSSGNGRAPLVPLSITQ